MKCRSLCLWTITVASLLVQSARPETEPPVADPARQAERVCPTCKRTFPASDRFCPVDGIPLADAEPKQQTSRVCPRCKRQYSDGSRFCSVDGAVLVAATGAASQSLRPNRAGNDRNPAVATARKTEAIDDRTAGESSADSERLDLPLAGPALTGSAYVSVLRSALLAPEKLRAAWEVKAEELAKRFQLERRVVLAIQFQADAVGLGKNPTDLDRELADRLRVADVHDVAVVSGASLSASMGWKRFRVEGRVVRDSGPDPRTKIELKLCDVDSEPVVGKDWSASESLEANGGDVASVPQLQGAMDQLARALIARLNWLRYEHFDAARRLAHDGQKGRAVEQFLSFLFCTSDFDTPQASEANQFVADELHFSVLDWLWGEPEAALQRQHGTARRLPLGFRAAPGEPSSGELPGTIVSLRDGMEMVLVPGGTELMGDDAGPDDERPAHRVALAPFYIDKLETSVAQYQRFLSETGHRVPQPDDAGDPTQWHGRAAASGSLSLPVVCVSWHDAMAYAQWAGKSLPTEAQWERAARGRFAADYRRSVDPSFAQHVNAGEGSGFGASESRRAGVQGSGGKGLMSVYSFPGAISPYGCQNMLGNAAEWCRDWYDPAYYAQSTSRDPSGPDAAEQRVVRGGSWRTPPEQLGPARRSGLVPTARSACVGFRGVLNLAIQY